jgi:hypothetical protein
MAVTSKVLSRKTLTTTSTDVLYTVPTSSTTTVITNIIVSNITGSSASFNLSLPDSSGTQVSIATGITVAANSIASFDLKQVIGGSGTQTVVGYASTGSALTIHISGVEIV